jgi:hypothetical protein
MTTSIDALHPSIRHLVIPDRVARLPLDDRGYPVPWFVQWLDAQDREAPPGQGRPEFRIMDATKLRVAIRERRCWVCGDVLGRHLAFVIGPMCALNRISAEPPNHRDCAEYAAKACPFLARPHARRRDAGLPASVVDDRVQTAALGPIADIPGISGATSGGFSVRRNPGVALVWITRSYELQTDGRGGVLFQVGDPELTLWFAEGRPATRAEVLHSIDTGMPTLRAVADREGSDVPHASVAWVAGQVAAAHAELDRTYARALALLPEASP